MKKPFLAIILILSFSIQNQINAQTVKKEKIKFSGTGKKKFNDAGKKIYIEQFSVNYQYIYAASKSTRGGRQMGGGYLGNAKAALFLGLDGIKAQELQKLTDELYADFTKKLKTKGFTIVTGETYKNHPYYKKADVFKGGEPFQYYKGFISTAPTGMIYLEKGKKFFASLKTSNELDGVIVARVNIMIPFAEDGESQGSRALTKTFGGVAKVVAKPNLRIGSTTIETKSKLGFEKYNTYSTLIDISYKKSLKYQASFTAQPRKEIAIANVLPTKKYKAVKSANQDLDGVSSGNYRIFNVPDAELEKMQKVSFKGDKYYKGVKEAADYFISTSIDNFLSNIN